MSVIHNDHCSSDSFRLGKTISRIILDDATTKTKVSSLPDLPTLDSSAVTGFEVSAWHAMWAPKGLPKDATDKLVAALQAALKDPKVIERFASLGTEPVPPDLATPEALKAHLQPKCRAGTRSSRLRAPKAIERN